jgi:hypothetical protein
MFELYFRMCVIFFQMSKFKHDISDNLMIFYFSNFIFNLQVDVRVKHQE